MPRVSSLGIDLPIPSQPERLCMSAKENSAAASEPKTAPYCPWGREGNKREKPSVEILVSVSVSVSVSDNEHETDPRRTESEPAAR